MPFPSKTLLPGMALSLGIAMAAQAQSTGSDFSEMDQDGSGAIEFEEFQHEHTVTDNSTSVDTDAQVDGFGDNAEPFDPHEGRDLDKTLVQRYDADGSGGLDRREYQEYQDYVTRRLRDF